ncbi:3-oxoacyl-[acyl-carrier-protein] synthase III C-terminal domain-containing protein [Kocuria rhizophila]|uniref:type III polyketide synthase n=1 Tax=Kocuria rhizophila TaxID=72000 RepID=UPI001ABE50EE|nr:3-oxoacyl-[acyl-carrier-protein] synthase III C-terminal domain-containing protein [Kocuria rhizophila]MBO4145893.1 type III polyketide synthase [Kocuria rhizophila]MDN3226177.1 3-oxoacyl-[acyl-carrier-protein] synthase III C-terminal domain-containing protein [Kocuria rhizophila]QTK32209.1 type III polyketide synthase [Kocuria rhizophila]
MTVRMLSIETLVPDTVIRQEDVTRLFAQQPGMTRLGSRLVRSAFDGAGVATRHTVLPELGTAVDRAGSAAGAGAAPSEDVPGGSPRAGGDAAASPFVDPGTGHLLSPGTHARNRIYTEHAKRLFVEAARAALDAAGDGVTAADVTHVITVSCTGFFAPGPDVRVAKDLGLPVDVKRAHFGFMGCNAAFPALQAAATACRADPDAVVLVVCVELCTLHLHVRNDPDTVMGNALFADGAAAAVVSARDVAVPGPTLELVDFETTLAPVGEEELAWSVGDEGFEMILGTYVPRIIDDHVSDALAPLLRRGGISVADIPQWAVHPGGRSILDKVEGRLSLTEGQMLPSREVLREAGNMSSATILFVLARLLQTGAPGPVAAMAFGPGLSIESALLRLLPAAQR